MAQFTAADIKPHLSRDAGDLSFDSVIDDWIAAAEAAVVAYLRRDLDEEFGTTWPEDIRQVVRMLVVHFDMNREAVLVGEEAAELPWGVKRLLAPHRDLAA